MYTQITLSALIQEIASDLQDTTHVYWTVDEIQRSVYEGMLYWGGLSAYWRNSGVFYPTVNAPFYNMATQFPVLRSRSYTLGQIVTEIQYMLLELPSGVSGTGMTGQFTIQQITDAVVRARNQFVLDSGVALNYESFGSISPPIYRFQLDSSIAAVSGCYWKQSTGAITPLRRQDSWAAQSSDPVWNVDPGVPVAFSTVETNPLELLVIPPPNATGEVHAVCNKTAVIPVLDVASLDTPDEFVCGIKYYALYLILSPFGLGQDTMRAKYALERYKAVVEASEAQRSIMRVRVNGVPTQTDPIEKLDSSIPYWQTETGQPSVSAASYDLLALYKVPDSNRYQIGVDLVQTAPLPTLSTGTNSDYVQMGREDIPYLKDYCKHILSFKMGGEEFTNTMGMHDNFMQGAMQRNKLLTKRTPYLSAIFNVPQRQEAAVPTV